MRGRSWTCGLNYLPIAGLRRPYQRPPKIIYRACHRAPPVPWPPITTRLNADAVVPPRRPPPRPWVHSSNGGGGARLPSERRSAVEADGGGEAEERKGTIPNVDQKLARTNSAALMRVGAPRVQRGWRRCRGDALQYFRNIVVAVDSPMTASGKWNPVGAVGRTRPAEGEAAPEPLSMSRKDNTRQGSAAWPRRDAALRFGSCPCRARLGVRRAIDQEKIHHDVN